jgi:hypothetical protein
MNPALANVSDCTCVLSALRAPNRVLPGNAGTNRSYVSEMEIYVIVGEHTQYQ